MHAQNYIPGAIVSIPNVREKKKEKKISTRMGFEPTRAEHNGLAVHRLNHSATSSLDTERVARLYKKVILQPLTYITH